MSKKINKVFCTPTIDDGTPVIQQTAGGFISGGAYGSYVDMEGGSRMKFL